MTNKIFFQMFLAVALTFSSVNDLSSQVTIGADSPPQSFSVLELFSNTSMGMRLPQMTQLQRDTLDGTQSSTAGISAGMAAARTDFGNQKTGKAMGLQIFNTDTKCVETWNGMEWIATCAPPAAPVAPAQQICSTGTVADLVATGEAGTTFNWYTTASGGVALTSSTVVSTLGAGTLTLYVSQTNTYGYESTRTSVAVTITGVCVALSPDAYKIFSPVSVMYTYQYQDLNLYKGVATGGDATRFKWYVKKKGIAGNGAEIPSATSATYRVQSNYTTVNDTLVFTCEYTNPATTTPQTVSTEIEFIKLDETKYEMINGVKYYWVELDAATSYTGATTSSGKIKMLATNLGVETANAADFGDLYQWGRVADGHEKIAWGYTGTASRTVAFDASTPSPIAKTTAVYGENTDFPGSFLQIVKGDALYGKFITVAPGDAWQANASTADEYIWATDTYAKTANDPCPVGWHVPTRYEWGALVTGTPAQINYSSGFYPSSYNTLRYPSAAFGSSAHVGGIVITQGASNPAGSTRVFLPASGLRDLDGTLTIVGGAGGYWCSTGGGTTGGFQMIFNSSLIATGVNDGSKASGYSVRCVAE